MRLVGEYRGKEALFQQQSPQLPRASATALSFTVLEFFEPHRGRCRACAAGPRSRRQASRACQPLRTGDCRLPRGPEHRSHELRRDAAVGESRPATASRPVPVQTRGGGRWKSSDNDITDVRPDGTTRVRFKPLAAHLVPDAMARLHNRYRVALDQGAANPLLLVPAYVLDFLCIHPFADGNGRMARLLSLLLLSPSGLPGRPVHRTGDRNRGHEGGLLRGPLLVVTGLARRTTFPRALRGPLRRRHADDGLPSVRGARRRHRRRGAAPSAT